jgi:two-component system nitrate/nitrite response regulator NarL
MSNVLNPSEADGGWRRRGRLVICLDNRLLAESLATALAHRGWTIEAVGTTEADALRQVVLYIPDICVLSAVFARGSGMPVASAIARTAPRTRTVVMAAAVDAATRAQARAAGIVAVVSEDRPINMVDHVLCRVGRGEAVVNAATIVRLERRVEARRLHHQAKPPPLTCREREVLALLSDGRSTTAVAAALGVSPATVRSHIQGVLTKLGVHTRLKAVAIYRADCGESDGQAV